MNKMCIITKEGGEKERFVSPLHLQATLVNLMADKGGSNLQPRESSIQYLLLMESRNESVCHFLEERELKSNLQEAREGKFVVFWRN